MGDDNQITTTVTEKDGEKQVTYGISLIVPCPSCKDDLPISEPLAFGRAYEFTCPVCKNVFTLAIPDLIVRRGRIEGLLYGERSSAS